jgi:hypothetical protein
LNQLVSSSSRRGFKAAIPKFFEFTEERVAETADLQLVQMVRLLRDAVLEFPDASRTSCPPYPGGAPPRPARTNGRRGQQKCALCAMYAGECSLAAPPEPRHVSRVQCTSTVAASRLGSRRRGLEA